MAERKRETISPHPGDKRYIRRDATGRFTTDQVGVGRSLARDNDEKEKSVNKRGQGHFGASR